MQAENEAVVPVVEDETATRTTPGEVRPAKR